MTLEEDSTTDDEDGSSLDELSTDEEDSTGFVSLLLDSTGLSELDDSSVFTELEDASVLFELEETSVFAELEDKTFLELEDISPLPLLLDSTLPELDENFPSLEELPPTAFSLDEDSLSLLDVNNKADPSLLSTTSSEVLDVISSTGLVEDSVSPPHPTNDMHVAPANRQRMIALKAEKRLGRERRIWVVILLILNKLLF
jgi:hypothetical protein